MPIAEIMEAVDAVSEADSISGGVQAGIAVGGAGLEVLSFALNPAAGIVGAALGPLMGLLINHFGPAKETMDALMGDPPAIRTNGDRWSKIGDSLRAAGESHQATSGDMPGWTGDAATEYQGVHADVQGLFASAASAADNFGQMSVMSGAVIGALREVLWGMIKDAVSEAVAGALIALASSWFSFGSSLAAYAGWLSARVSGLLMNVANRLRQCGGLLARVGTRLAHAAVSLRRAATALGHLDGRIRAANRFKDRVDHAKEATNAAKGAAATDREDGSGNWWWQ